ncbi:complex 1 protein [Pseudovirgaria hyperparasitica]|uniref:Complex 1 protein n=1 Tax=Pseudovirgaria hyperparasitica TaxID=470096 RepID=A0A6A6VZW2_9PEZI|nr:complex 1 protein [Pseudovirgaria hyperparasitica]KAF2755833.1 complex 1 protein [Pseudovirgaria hyperparasitica]
MTINATYLARTTRTSADWADARNRVIHSYRQWLRACPEIQSMYKLNLPIAALRTKLRQEFERHRYVNQLKTVDVLIFQAHAEFQETLNFWKQKTNVMKYFQVEEDNKKQPHDFMGRFLEGRN